MHLSEEEASTNSQHFRQFFSLLDDGDLDVRTVAEESINRVINALRDSHSGRLQVELYKEIKKTGSARCLAVALSRFSRLARLIRPQKCRAFVVNLMPPIVKVKLFHGALSRTKG